MKEKIEVIAEKVCRNNEVGLYDVELKNTRKGKVICVYITKINGVTVDECQKVSRDLGQILEDEDLISGRYFLEVSSPGLERELKLKKHYLSAINEKIKISYSKDDKIHTKIGILKEVLPEKIMVLFDKNPEFIHFSDIRKVKTYFDYKK
ncbi:MAG: hypothetical protein B6D62_01845 [Candidatus Cloacimonas sp. 4484_275]|nr:MAG: hypothetical protein B6D62_01845 [Candidatus Cloacimonas sp. 4484_275]RLC51924.1 MAG: ribosome assembly cofactor RimP [Candidatus Cloacimonadota bacterium]